MTQHTLVSNSIFNVIYRLLNMLYPMITAIYIARVIDAKCIGEIAFAQNVTQYFVLISVLGLPNYGTREIAKTRGEAKKTNKIFSELFILNAISTSICLIVYITIIFTVPAFNSNLILFLVTGINIFLNYINVDWLYQGFEQYGYIAIRSFMVKIISLISVFIFIKKSDDYILYAFITVLALAGNNVYNILHLSKIGISFSIDHINIKGHLKPVLSLLCTTIAIEFYTLLDTTMLGLKSSVDNVAFYNYAMRISRSIISLVAAIGGVLLPRMSYYRKHGKIRECAIAVEKTLDVMIYLLLPSSVVIFFCAKEIVLCLYGDGFINSIPILMISSLLVIALGFSNLFGTQILITFGKENKLLIATIIGAISNFLLNYFLIDIYQGIGAVIASVVSEALVTLITLFEAKKCMEIRISKRNLYISIISCSFMICAILMLKSTIYNVFILLVLEIISSIFVYLLLTIIFHLIISV